MPSMEKILDTIGQITEAFLKGINTLANTDLHGLEVLGLFLGINFAITEFKKLIRHRW